MPVDRAALLFRRRISAWSRMPKRSAGLLVYRRRQGVLEVFLVHPGGPLWAKKNLGAWTIPKGEYLGGEEQSENPGEDPLQAALREFHEETGFQVNGDFHSLGAVTQAGGKLVSAWACAGDFDAAKLTSNSCEIEWPPRSGRRITIPEVDRGDWFAIAEAQKRILKSQQPFLDRLLKILD
jgi:predicted NUDIX family NTP pyrophosphohydrolase